MSAERLHTNSEWLFDCLACPRDHADLVLKDGCLCCEHGHRYPIINDIPIFLLPEKEQTIDVASATMDCIKGGARDSLYIDTLGISETEKQEIERQRQGASSVDPVVSQLVAATCGLAYSDLVGQLQGYPIPNIPVGDGFGKLLLDVGSNWGRWSISAAQKGWRVVGIDPSLGALMAAKRAFSHLGLDAAFVCGDARFLPFKNRCFRCAFSYSVIQHFSEADAQTAIAECGRVLREGGTAKIQMAHAGGLRSTYSRTRPDYLNAGVFRVRYWTLTAMRETFESRIGPTTLVAEAFGGLGLLSEDFPLVSTPGKIAVLVSSVLKKLAFFLNPLIHLADSVYVISVKR